MELFVIQRGCLRLFHNEFVVPEQAEEWLVELGAGLVPCDGDTPPPWRLDTGMGPVMAKVGRGTSYRRLARLVTCSRSRSLSAYHVGTKLHASGIPTPRPLAVLERKRAGVVIADMLLTDWIEAPDLSLLLASSEPGERAALISSAARLIAALHAARYRHRDLKASNLLSTPDGSELLVADLDGVRCCAKDLSHRRRVRDLSRLMVSFVVFGGPGGHASEPSDADVDRRCATDGVLLLERYLEASPDLRGDGGLLESWQAQATDWVRRKVSVNLSAGRPLS